MDFFSSLVLFCKTNDVSVIHSARSKTTERDWKALIRSFYFEQESVGITTTFCLTEGQSEQGCQMVVYFQTKKRNLNFFVVLGMEILENFMSILVF
jgi:hypothetical protein